MFLFLVSLGFSVDPVNKTNNDFERDFNETDTPKTPNWFISELEPCSVEVAMQNPTTTKECYHHAQGMFYFASPNEEEFEAGLCVHAGNRWTHLKLSGNRLIEFPGECACPKSTRSALDQFLFIVKKTVNHFTAVLFAEIMAEEHPDEILSSTPTYEYYVEADYAYDHTYDYYYTYDYDNYDADMSYDTDTQLNFLRDPNMTIEQKIYHQLFVCDDEDKYSLDDECDEIIATLAHTKEPTWERVAAIKEIQNKIEIGRICCAQNKK